MIGRLQALLLAAAGLDLKTAEGTVPSAGRFQRRTKQRRGGGNGGRPARDSRTRSRATRPAASGRHATHLDLPADLPFDPRCEKPASRRPMITPWVCFALLWVWFAAGPGTIAKRR